MKQSQLSEVIAGPGHSKAVSMVPVVLSYMDQFSVLFLTP